MHFAFDLGTITDAPSVLKEVASCLMGDRLGWAHPDNKVTVLTACFNGEPTREEKLKLLSSHGFHQGLEFDQLVIVEGKDLSERGFRKAEFCRDHQVDMIFEDCDIYIEEINRLSPKTVCWRIRLSERNS